MVTAEETDNSSWLKDNNLTIFSEKHNSTIFR